MDLHSLTGKPVFGNLIAHWRDTSKFVESSDIVSQIFHLSIKTGLNSHQLIYSGQTYKIIGIETNTINISSGKPNRA